MTPAQRAAARTAHTEAVTALNVQAVRIDEWDAYDDSGLLADFLNQFVRHTEVLAGHLALALEACRPVVVAATGTVTGVVVDPFDGLTGPEAVGASEPPPALHPTEGPTP